MNHIKTVAAPKTWPVKRKSSVFITRPKPGRHSFALGLSLGTALKSMLGLAQNNREVRYLLNQDKILLNGVSVKKIRHLIGFMDVLTIPEEKKQYRMILNEQGKLELLAIDASDSNNRITRVKSKTKGKKGVLTLGTLAGDVFTEKKTDVKVGDCLLIDIKEKKIAAHLPFKVGAQAMLLFGKHKGSIGTIKEIKDNIVMFKTNKNDEFSSPKKYVFVVGTDKVAVKIA